MALTSRLAGFTTSTPEANDAGWEAVGFRVRWALVEAPALLTPAASLSLSLRLCLKGPVASQVAQW